MGETADRLSIETAVAGSRPKSLLVRALGPALETFSATPVLADPDLSISRGRKLDVQIDDWRQTPDQTALQAATSEVGAAPLKVGDKDAAILASFGPGPLTAQVHPKENATPGVAMLEVFDADLNDSNRLIRFCARGQMGVGSNSLIAGFATVGEGNLRLLIRGIDPVLKPADTTENSGSLNLYRGPDLIATSGSGNETPTESECAAAQVVRPRAPQ